MRVSASDGGLCPNFLQSCQSAAGQSRSLVRAAAEKTISEDATRGAVFNRKSAVGFSVGLRVFHTDDFSLYNKLLCGLCDDAPGTIDRTRLAGAAMSQVGA